MAQRSARGADAERRTAEELAQGLPPTYRIFHGLKIGRTRADIDHVVIGPTGVWVIDSKCWNGPAEITDGRLHQGRYPKQDQIDGVEKQANYAKAALGLPTNPTLCFVDTPLPRPMQAVGRVRVIALDALVHHMTSVTPTLSAAQVESAYRKALAWEKRPPDVSTPSPARTPTQQQAQQRAPRTKQPTPPKATPSSNGKKRSANSGCARATLTAVATIIGLVAVLSLLSKSTERLTSRSRTTTTTVSAVGSGPAPGSPAADTPGYFTVEIECPEPGKGYRFAGRATDTAPGRLRITMVSALGPEYLGEIGPYERLRPASRIGPSTNIGFDVQVVNDVGQGGEAYRLDVTTPAVPC